jgi:hypothetical protein
MPVFVMSSIVPIAFITSISRTRPFPWSVVVMRLGEWAETWWGTARRGRARSMAVS